MPGNKDIFLLKTIRASLTADSSDQNLKYWAKYIVENNIEIQALLPLIHASHPAGMRFSWMLGGMCETNPAIVAPLIPYLFSKRHIIEIPHFNRSLAKFFYHCGIPDAIEGEATDALFQWLIDPVSNISTRREALLALFKITKKYPELIPELKLRIDDLTRKYSPAFDKLLNKIYEQLP